LGPAGPWRGNGTWPPLGHPGGARGGFLPPALRGPAVSPPAGPPCGLFRTFGLRVGVKHDVKGAGVPQEHPPCPVLLWAHRRRVVDSPQKGGSRPAVLGCSYGTSRTGPHSNTDGPIIFPRVPPNNLTVAQSLRRRVETTVRRPQRARGRLPTAPPFWAP
jgi:hypothetical protein